MRRSAQTILVAGITFALGFLIPLFFCARVHGATLGAFSFEEGDADSTNPDSFLWTETQDGAGDSGIGLSTTAPHVTDNGGSSTSRYGFKATGASGNSPVYHLNPGVLVTSNGGYAFNLGTIAASFAYHQPDAGRVASGTGNARAIFCFNEKSNSDVGCCWVARPSGILDLAYLGSDETTAFGTCASDANCDADEKCYGNKCRKVWASTTAGQIEDERCDGDFFELPCTGTCPVGSTCGGKYQAVLEIGQIRSSSSIVECNGRINGRTVSTGIAKSLAESVVDTVVAGPGSGSCTTDNNCSGSEKCIGGTCHSSGGISIGMVPVGGFNEPAAEVYLDSIVVKDEVRAKKNYVAAVKPIASATCTNCLTGNWQTETCSRGSSLYQCINDYNVSGTSVYDSGADDENAISTNGANQKYDFPSFGPPWTKREQETVTAVNLLSFGRRVAVSGSVSFNQSLLACPTNQSGVATCTASINATTLDLSFGTTGSLYATARFLQSFVLAAPPIANTTWDQHYGAIGARLDAKTGGNRKRYVGALVANVVVERPDGRKPIWLSDKNGDGLVVGCAQGASTLLGTGQGICIGGTTPGAVCNQADYCPSLDAENKDQPAGGCNGSDTPCKVCEKEISTQCTSDASCDFGTCGGTPSVCSTDGRSCNTANGNADCQKGPCLTGALATCTPSCPGGGVCTLNVAGWASPIIKNIPFDRFAAFAVGGETSGQGFWNRDSKIVRGRLIGIPDANLLTVGGSGALKCDPGTTASCGKAFVGAGVCECRPGSEGDDCGGTCTNGASSCCVNGLCASSAADPQRRACTQGNQCNQAWGNACNVGACDYLFIGQGVNDPVVKFQEVGGPWHYGQDTECATPTSYLSINPNGLAVGAGQVEWCPDFGAGAYKVTATSCTADPACTGLAHDSTCVGLCDTASLGQCARTNDCQNQAPCTMEASLCDVNADCPIAGQTCVGGHPEFPGVLNTGRCSCSQDSHCPTNYICAGPAAGPKFCRQRCGCTTGSDCAKPCSGANECAGSCTSNGQCSTGTCLKSTGSACASAATCPTGWSCTGGFCTAPSGACLNPVCTTGRCTAGHNDLLGTCTSNKCTAASYYGGPTGATCNSTYCQTTNQCDSTDALHSFIEGRCVATCSAIPCTTDKDCTKGVTYKERWQFRSFKPEGICNNPTGGANAGRCTNCGLAMCAEIEQASDRGCSCTSDAECDGTGGSCDTVAKECKTAAARPWGARFDCHADKECAAGRRCLRPTKQLNDYQASHWGLLAEGAKWAWDKIQREFNFGPCNTNSMTCARLPGRGCSTDDACDDAAAMYLTGVPIPNGVRLGTGSILPDLPCYQRNPGAAGTWVNRAYFASTYSILKGIVPDHRIVYPHEYNAARMYGVGAGVCGCGEGGTSPPCALITDQCHNGDVGACLAGYPFVTALEKADTCLASGGTPQRYCQQTDETFPPRCTCVTDADCDAGGATDEKCTGGFCTAGSATRVVCTGTIGTQGSCASSRICTDQVFCTTDAGCALGESCNLRKCFQSAGNCPGTSMSCGAD